MFAGVRPYVTAGVALVGAGVIAVTPVGPPPPQTPVVTSAVQLAAIPSPLTLYPKVFGTALHNAGALLETYFANPSPILRATAENQATAVQDAFIALEFGRGDEFFTALADVFAQPSTSADAALSYLGAIIGQPFGLEFLSYVARSPMLNGIAAAGTALWDVVEAAIAIDLVGVVNAVVNIPARIIDGVLNGGYATVGYFGELGGLLSPVDEDGERVGGPIAISMMLAGQIADTIPERTPLFPIAEPPGPDSDGDTPTAQPPSETAPPQEVPVAEEASTLDVVATDELVPEVQDDEDLAEPGPDAPILEVSEEEAEELNALDQTAETEQPVQSAEPDNDAAGDGDTGGDATE
ncbi:hypothetical protein NGTWS1803_23460 [Mycolicibacterium cyprinidarum]|nr:hypothetical protein NGTWS1803_23460 [Mycolicibacterium sp. NGTWS1803]